MNWKRKYSKKLYPGRQMVAKVDWGGYKSGDIITLKKELITKGLWLTIQGSCIFEHEMETLQ